MGCKRDCGYHDLIIHIQKKISKITKVHYFVKLQPQEVIRFNYIFLAKFFLRKYLSHGCSLFFVLIIG